MIGHEGYLTEVYRVHYDKDLAKFYLKAQPALLVFQDAEQIALSARIWRSRRSISKQSLTAWYPRTRSPQ